jgi:hypothetical protein
LYWPRLFPQQLKEIITVGACRQPCPLVCASTRPRWARLPSLSSPHHPHSALGPRASSVGLGTRDSLGTACSGTATAAVPSSHSWAGGSRPQGSGSVPSGMLGQCGGRDLMCASRMRAEYWLLGVAFISFPSRYACAGLLVGSRICIVRLCRVLTAKCWLCIRFAVLHMLSHSVGFV